MAMPRRTFVLRSALATSAVLAVFVALAAWQLRDARIASDANARAQALAVQRLVETQRGDDLARRAELVADDPAFAGYVEMAMGGALPGVEVDTTSLVDLLGERRERLGFAFVAVLDPNGRVIGSTSPLLQADQRESGAVFVQARDRDATTTGLWTGRDGLYQVAVVPLAAVGVSEGFLMTGSALGDEFARSIASAARADVMLLPSRAARPVASTLADAPSRALAQQLADTPASVALRIDDRGVIRVPLLATRDVELVMLPRVSPAGPAAWLPWLLAGIALLVAAVAAAMWTWRAVLAPAALLAERLERARGGDLHVVVADADAGELAPLAASFNGLLARVRERGGDAA